MRLQQCYISPSATVLCSPFTKQQGKYGTRDATSLHPARGKRDSIVALGIDLDAVYLVQPRGDGDTLYVRSRQWLLTELAETGKAGAHKQQLSLI